MIIVRYADDIVVGFEHEADARRFWDAMRTRFEEFALSLHPDKTRLIEFGRHAADRRAQRGLGKPETFNFLGFTFICGRSRTGKFLLKRKSRRDRMRGKLKEIKEELRRRMHQPIPEQGKWLAQVVTGLLRLSRRADQPLGARRFPLPRRRLWLRTLRRRSQKDRLDVAADREARRRLAPETENPSSMAARSALPSNTRGRSRMRESPPVRICAGGGR